MSKLYIQDETGGFKELGEIESLELNNADDLDNLTYTGINVEGDFSFEITDKNDIRRIKNLFKTKKDRQEEIEYNKNQFRDFIKNKKR